MALSRTWYNTLIDDDGSNTVGTLWNKAAVDSLMDAVDVALLDTVITSTLTGAQDNWAPALAGHTLILWNGGADVAFTGLAGGVAGQRVTVKNISNFVATFARLSGSSSTANQFANAVTSGPMPIALSGWITYQHSGTNWVIIGHDQGAWISPAFNAANFTAYLSMTWTVQSGDVVSYAYRLSGKTLSVVFKLATTTVGGTLSGLLQVTIPGGFTAAVNPAGTFTHLDNNAPEAIGFAYMVVSGTLIYLSKNPTSNWTASTNLTEVSGRIDVAVN